MWVSAIHNLQGKSANDSSQCVDITFAEPEDVPKVTPDNCANTSNIGFQYTYSTNLSSGAEPMILSTRTTWLASLPLAAMVALGMMI
jgi:hypothetical protein